MKTQTSKIRTLLAGAALVALVASPLARADYASTVLSQSPRAYYRLNETLSPSVIAGAANSGTLGGAVLGTFNNYPSRGLNGPFAGSKAVALDGTSQTVTTPWQAAINPTNFTLEIWANPDQAPFSGSVAYVASSAHIASPRNGWYLAQDNGGTFGHGSAFCVRFFKMDTTVPSADLYATIDGPVGTWYHLVLTYDGTTATLYKNGSTIGSTNSSSTTNWVPNLDSQFSLGYRSDGGFPWPGKLAEVAIYNGALTSLQASNHYYIATNTPASYGATVTADAPVLWYRFQEAIDPPAANSSTLGSALNGFLIYDAQAGVAGPVTPTYTGFDAANKAVAFDNGGGVVRIPPLNLNTNTVTISCWINATNAQQVGAGIVLQGSGANACGLTIDQIYGGLGLGYIWNGNTYGVSPSVDLGLPALPDSQWAYAALVIRPSQAEIYICDANNSANFTSITNAFQVNHANQAFASPTLVGAAAGFAAPLGTLNGAVDEVTIFNRALSAGELYTQYAAAVGGVSPRIFADLQGPAGDVAAGDPIVLTVDAGGTPDLTFTWHKAGGGTIAITTNGVLTIASAVLGDTGTYDVTISNGAGSANSQTVVVNVVTPSTPAITEILGYKNRTLYLGATLRLQVLGTGGGLKYQWYKNAVPIPLATSSVYSVGVTNISQAGSFSVSVTNSVGTTTSGPPVVISIPNMASNSYEGLIITSGPESWWRLDEVPGSTNMFDGMGRHDGIYTNLLGTSPPVALGVPGALVGDTNTGASFSGNQGIGLISNSPALSPAKFTIEAWVRTTITDDPNLSPLSSIYGANGEYWRTSPVGEWRPYSSAAQAPLKDNGQTNAVVVQNQWTHLVMAYDSSIAGFPWIYAINGFRATTSWSGAAANTEGPIIIGAAGVNATTLAQFFWKGQVDEVAIYPRVLSNAEIADHYAARGVEILPPTFSEPLLSQTVTTGKSISFNTTVFGTSPVLRWYKGAPLASAPIATGTNALYFNPTALSDTGTYSLVASNSAASVTNTASLTVISPVAYANVTNNLVLHLTFDTDTSDSSGHANNGTASSSPAPAFVPGIIGAQALQYTTTAVTNQPGTNIAASTASYVTLGTVGSGPPADLQFGATSFSISLWVKLPASALLGDLPFIGTATNSANNPGWVLAPSYHGGGWQWDLSDGTGNTLGNNIDVNGPANSINDGAWHNFVLAVDRTGAVADSYLDGVHTASKSLTGFGSVANNNYWPIVIGQDPTGIYPFIAGTNASANDYAAWFPPNTATVDDIGIWRRALTPLEVAQVASAGSAGRSFNTVAPVVPLLSISTSGGNVVLTYSGGTLVESTDPTVTKDAWTPVGGASSPWPVTPSAVQRYYSVRQ